MRTKDQAVAALLAIMTINMSSVADVATIFRDRDEWETAVGNYTTITFMEISPNSVLHNQYLSSGIQFSGMNAWTEIDNSDFPLDGHGAVGAGPIHALMSDGFIETPAQWIAVNFHVRVGFQLYRDSKMIYQSPEFWAHQGGTFAGLMLSEPFDEVRILRFGGGLAMIDNLYFGIPAPGALAIFGFAALFGGSRRRAG